MVESCAFPQIKEALYWLDYEEDQVKKALKEMYQNTFGQFKDVDEGIAAAIVILEKED